ncbi:HAD hydrolase-like protein [Desulfosporosinus sp. SB140]|uniref:HAD hydrolase-like protein n=1 Tax=Desulfosporosinus paludis TaxID=3115649 RepID=UPI00388D9F27
MNIDSIIFDLDGTLWNSIEGICEAWNTILANYPNITRVVTPEDMEGCMGLPINEIGKKLFLDLEENFQMKLPE